MEGEYEKIENPISSSNTMVKWQFFVSIYTVVSNNENPKKQNGY